MVGTEPLAARERATAPATARPQTRVQGEGAVPQVESGTHAEAVDEILEGPGGSSPGRFGRDRQARGSDHDERAESEDQPDLPGSPRSPGDTASDRAADGLGVGLSHSPAP